jgi:hypothetical protein
VLLGSPVDVAEQASGTYIGEPAIAIDRNAPHQRHVERKATLSDGRPSDVVASSFDAEHEPVIASEVNGLADVLDGRRLEDERRYLGDHAVPDSDCFLPAYGSG